jgi:hypothetical protein
MWCSVKKGAGTTLLSPYLREMGYDDVIWIHMPVDKVY